MMIYIDQCRQFVEQEVTIQGWLVHKRSSGQVRFLVLRDGTGILQAVLLKNKVSPEAFQAFDQLTQESSLALTGILHDDSRAPGGLELELSELKIFQVAQPYPISPKEHGIAFLMEHRHLWLRSARQQAILWIRHELIRAIRDFLDAHQFIQLDAPILTPAACEGTSTLFSTSYFDQGNAFLSQSGQLYMEAGAMAFGRVYCFGPSFRAEKSKTRRHLTEFWMVEPEIAFADLEELISWAEQLIAFMITRVLENRLEELKLLERDITRLEKVKPPLPRLTYTQALELLKEQGLVVAFGEDLGGDEETCIASQFDQPVVIHRYPAGCKAFYMKKDPQDPRVVLNMDILAPEGYGEIIGGSQREEDLERLQERVKEQALSQEDIEWYLDLRRFGTVPHGGFGLGLERMVAWVCGLKHVREAIPFPRTLYRLYP
ncbi:MAG: asparagine--tRNA ligase [Deltaproteobacteria bacterium]|nr:asparagine--tRNA ligase [Deltaproteobacteria bacterium]